MTKDGVDYLCECMSRIVLNYDKYQLVSNFNAFHLELPRNSGRFRLIYEYGNKCVVLYTGYYSPDTAKKCLESVYWFLTNYMVGRSYKCITDSSYTSNSMVEDFTFKSLCENGFEETYSKCNDEFSKRY